LNATPANRAVERNQKKSKNLWSTGGASEAGECPIVILSCWTSSWDTSKRPGNWRWSRQAVSAATSRRSA